jgi:hypothetical protein
MRILYTIPLILAVSQQAVTPRDVPPERSQIAKAAWDWTDDERLAVRFDPIAIQERASRDATEPYSARSVGATQQSSRPTPLQSPSGPPNLVVGRRNPELFLPFELFNILISSGFSSDAKQNAEFRRSLEPVISKSIKAETFWADVESAAALLIENQNEEHTLGGQIKHAATDDDRAALRQRIKNLQQPQCLMRARALSAVADRIGRRAFYRILYEGIAPTVNTTSTDADLAMRLRFAAGGCQ